MLSGSGVGGAEKRFARLFRHLASVDQTYRLFINQSLLDALGDHHLDFARHAQVDVLSEPLGPFSKASRRRLYMLSYSLQCLRLVARHRIRTVHLLGSGTYVGMPLLLVPRLAVVVSLYNVKVDGPVSNLARPLFAAALRHADAIDALSEDIRDRLLTSAYNSDGRLADKVHVTPCSFADYDVMEPEEPKLDRVVFLGRLDPIKQPMLLVEAIPAILARHPGVKFEILGSGPQRDAIEARLRALGVLGAVELGHVSRPEAHLSRSKVFVSLQVENNYPSQSLLEAMACGNAIVATDVGETARLVDETTGIRVPATAEAVATAVSDLLADPERIKASGRAARARVLSAHTIERAAEYLRGLHLAARR